MIKKVCFLTFLFLLIMPINGFPDTLTVGPGKTYSTISAALDACSSGDTIEIYDDTYRESYTILASTKSWDNVTIKAATGETAVYWQNDDTAYSTIDAVDNWTLTDCAGTDDCYKTANSTLTDYVHTIFYDSGGGTIVRVKPENSYDGSKTLVDADNEFWFDKTNDCVYMRITDNADPDTKAIYLQDGSGSAQGTLYIRVNSTRDIDGLTIDGINFRFAALGGGQYQTGMIVSTEDAPSGTAYDLKNFTVKNCSFQYIGAMAISLEGISGNDTALGPDDVLIEDNTFDNCGGNNWTYKDGSNPNGQAWSTLSFGEGVGKVTIQDNTFDNAFRYHLSWIGANNTPRSDKELIFQRNTLNGGAGYAHIYNFDWSAGLRLPKDTPKVTIQNNIITEHQDSGIWFQYNATYHADEVYIYNNTILYNCQANSPISGADQCDGLYIDNAVDTALEIKGNIIWGHRRGRTSGWTYLKEMRIRDAPGDIATSDIDYNLWDSEDLTGTTFDMIDYEGTAKTWAGWTTLGYDANGDEESYGTDSNYPDFTDNQTDGTGDYHIDATSPGCGTIPTGQTWTPSLDIDEATRTFPKDMGADEAGFNVTIMAQDSSASEAGPDTGTFRVTRTGGTSGNLVVNFTLGGTASSGDYDEDLSGGSVTILDTNTYVDQTITPTDDSDVEGSETLTMTIAADSYDIGSPSQATIYIADNESVEGEAGLVIFGSGTGSINRDSSGTGSIVRQ